MTLKRSRNETSLKAAPTAGLCSWWTKKLPAPIGEGKHPGEHRPLLLTALSYGTDGATSHGEGRRSHRGPGAGPKRAAKGAAPLCWSSTVEQRAARTRWGVRGGSHKNKVWVLRRAPRRAALLPSAAMPGAMRLSRSRRGAGKGLEATCLFTSLIPACGCGGGWMNGSALGAMEPGPALEVIAWKGHSKARRHRIAAGAGLGAGRGAAERTGAEGIGKKTQQNERARGSPAQEDWQSSSRQSSGQAGGRGSISGSSWGTESRTASERTTRRKPNQPARQNCRWRRKRHFSAPE